MWREDEPSDHDDFLKNVQKSQREIEDLLRLQMYHCRNNLDCVCRFTPSLCIEIRSRKSCLRSATEIVPAHSRLNNAATDAGSHFVTNYDLQSAKANLCFLLEANYSTSTRTPRVYEFWKRQY